MDAFYNIEEQPMSGLLAANASWFDFQVQSGDFAVYAFSGREEVCKPYEFVIELVSRSADADIAGLLGSPACLSIADRSGEKRLVHGLIRRMEQLHTANRFTHYRCVLAPRLKFLDQVRDHRIFQNLSVVQIIQQILQEQGFSGDATAFKLFYDYAPREYCVQYGETDLHFITRLCEEEGIYFYFEHRENSHCVCFCDREGGPKIAGESDLRFYPGSGQISDTAVISRLRLMHQVNSNAATYREWNFQKPRLSLEVTEHEQDAAYAPTPHGMLLEQYRFPHLYQLRDPGARYVNLQLLRQLTFRRWIEAESDVARFLPSYTFSIHDHPRADVNADWWVTAVRHEGEQPGVLEHEAPDDRGLRYQSTVTAIPDMTRFIPKPEHPKNRVDGVQSAIVTGPGGEEVFTDEYGRVKVQFHWDREGRYDEKTTCWVRVADSWAGDNFGFIQVPRIGQEVMVEYMEGDPDRPLITGRVYNTLKMPPWRLPGQKTLSGMQSREFKAGRRNQLVLDDTSSEIQAQLSSDHDLSQLNLGYITRINHVEGRKDFRGEGFELRTDGWGVVRAAKGLYLSTDGRSKAEKHQKDLSEASTLLQNAAAQHDETAHLASVHHAQDAVFDGNALSQVLHAQSAAVHGAGKPHGELNEPHMVLSSPAGIALTTPRSTHMHTVENTAVTTGGHFSASTGKSFMVSALDKVSLFAHKLGMRLFAGQGKLEIQAQSDDLQIIAAKVLQIISTQKSIHLTAPEEITLAAGGSYIRIDKNGIEEGTKGKWIARAASHSMTGASSLEPPLPDLPSGTVQFDEQFRVIDDITGDPVADMRYELHFEDGAVVSGITGKDGIIPRQNRLTPSKVIVKLLGKAKI